MASKSTPDALRKTAADIEHLVGTPPEIVAFNGPYDGAAKSNKQIDLWNPPLTSADAEILPASST